MNLLQIIHQLFWGVALNLKLTSSISQLIQLILTKLKSINRGENKIANNTNNKINDKDLNLRLLGNLPIEIKDVGKIYSPKLIEIAEIGELEYNNYLGLISLDKDYFKKNNNLNNELSFEEREEFEKEINKLSIFQFIYISLYQNIHLRQSYLDALSFFFKEKVYFYENGFLHIDTIDKDKIISDNNFDLIIETIKKSNCLKTNNEDDDYNPANDKAKEIADKIRKSREKVNKLKAKNNESLDLFDLISAFSTYQKIDLDRVYEMTIFRFYDQFKRMQKINEYDISIQSLLHGADPKKVEIKNFVCRLGND